MEYFISFFMVVFALAASSALYFQPEKDLYLRLFPWFLVLTAVGVGSISYLSYRGMHNLVVFNLLTIFQVSFYFFVLYRLLNNRIAKKAALYLIFLYPLAAAYDLLFVQKGNFHSITYSLGGLLVVTLCVFYFLELFQRQQAGNLLRRPDFWICSGLLVYFTCTFPIYGLLNFLIRTSPFILKNIGNLFTLLDILLFTSFAIAFLCRLRTRKLLS